MGTIPIMALQDLVQVKKTQREKDWPMLKRLVEADMARAKAPIPVKRLGFWFRECRTTDRLIQLIQQFSRQAKKEAGKRRVVKLLLAGEAVAAERELVQERRREMELDRRYRAPLRSELEGWRMQRPRRRDS